MDQELTIIMTLLNQISVSGDDVDRMFVVKQKISRLSASLSAAKSPLNNEKELSQK